MVRSAHRRPVVQSWADPEWPQSASADLPAQRAPHRALREPLAALNAQGLALDTLSMGMSADLEAAVAEGATIVRVGSALFGSRT
jgi:PLP dependent protein